MDQAPDSHSPVANVFLAGLFVFFLSAGAIFSTVVPLGEAPDEPAHFLYVRYVARNGALPVMQPRHKDNEIDEAFQAPAYYVLAALITRFTMQEEARFLRNPAFSFISPGPIYLPLVEHSFPWQGSYLAWRLVRFFSLALGLVSLWATYRASWLAFENRWLALAAVAYLAMNPQFIYLHGVVTNDALATTTGSLMTLVALLLLRAPALKSFVAAASVIALAVLSKPSALTLFPGLALALLIAWRALPSARERWLAVGLLVAIPLGCSGWWLLRNWHLYGDFLGLAAARQTLVFNYYSEPLSMEQFIALLPSMLWQTFRSSWGYFGWLSFPLPDFIFYLILLLHVSALIGLLLGFRKETGFLREARFLWSVPLVLAGAWLGLVLSFLYYNVETNASGWQGRFLFPGSSIVAMGFVAGWRHWFKRREATLVGLAIVWGVLLVIYALAGVVFPTYLPPRFLPPDTPVPNRYEASFAGGLQLVGYEIEPVKVAPGSYVQLTLYWRIQRKVEKHYRFFVGGYTDHGDPIVPKTESFLPLRFPPIIWPVGRVVADRYQLPVSQELNQVVGRLTLRVFEDYWDPRLVSYVDGAGEPAGDRVRLGQVIIGFETQPQSPRNDVQARLGADALYPEEILLSGYEISPAAVHPGETLTVTLHWQAMQQSAQSYHVFVHLLDQEGQLIAQHDGVPRGGLYPTSAWSPGEMVVDVHPIQVPATHEGTARLFTGLYSLGSLERLPVIDAGGKSYPDRALPLVTIVVDR